MWAGVSYTTQSGCNNSPNQGIGPSDYDMADRRKSGSTRAEWNKNQSPCMNTPAAPQMRYQNYKWNWIFFETRACICNFKVHIFSCGTHAPPVPLSSLNTNMALRRLCFADANGIPVITGVHVIWRWIYSLSKVSKQHTQQCVSAKYFSFPCITFSHAFLEFLYSSRFYSCCTRWHLK